MYNLNLNQNIMRHSNVFFRAWSIRKQNPQFTMRKALLTSWRAEKLRKSMEGGNVVEFVFVKLDGTIRIAKGTIPELKMGLEGKIKTVGQNSVVNYFDVEKDAWRSFKAVQLVQVFS